MSLTRRRLLTTAALAASPATSPTSAGLNPSISISRNSRAV